MLPSVIVNTQPMVPFVTVPIRGCNQRVIFFNTFFESQDFSYLSASLIDRVRSMGEGRFQGCLLAYQY